MRLALQFFVALAIATLCVVGFRALAFTLYEVEGDALAPELLQGDQILVNRWSYGLRTGSPDGLFPYGRIFSNPIEKGDLVAFDSPIDSLDGIFVCRCRALSGDTVRMDSNVYIVPGRKATCAKEDYYWMEAVGDGASIDSRQLGPIPESCVIGRVCMVLYSRDPSRSIFDGFRTDRTFLLK